MEPNGSDEKSIFASLANFDQCGELNPHSEMTKNHHSTGGLSAVLPSDYYLVMIMIFGLISVYSFLVVYSFEIFKNSNHEFIGNVDF